MLAALTNALRVVGKRLEDVRIVVSGVGAAGHAIIRLLLAQGAGDDHRAATATAPSTPGRTGLDPFRAWIAEHTNPRQARRHAEGGAAPAPTSSSASPRRTC